MTHRPVDWARALAAGYLDMVQSCKRVHNHGGALYVQGVDVPWVYGSRPDILIEPWSHWHMLHRRKNGFSAVAQRLRSLIKSSGDSFALEVWEVDAEPLDADLVAKWARQIERPITVVHRAGLAAHLASLEEAAPAPGRFPNPLIEAINFRAQLRAAVAPAPESESELDSEPELESDSEPKLESDSELEPEPTPA